MCKDFTLEICFFSDDDLMVRIYLFSVYDPDIEKGTTDIAETWPLTEGHC